jgi:hypothetical protein
MKIENVTIAGRNIRAHKLPGRLFMGFNVWFMML